MGYDRDKLAWLRAGAEQLGSQGALGRYLGMKKQQISRLMHGRGDLTGEQLERLLKLLKRLGCVLIALGGLTQAPDGGATSMPSARTTPPSLAAGQRDNFTTYTLCIVRAFWRWVVGKLEPRPLRPAL